MEGVLRSKVQTVDVKHHQFLAQLRDLVQNKFFIAGWTHSDIYQGDFLYISKPILMSQKVVSHLKVITIQQHNFNNNDKRKNSDRNPTG